MTRSVRSSGQTGYGRRIRTTSAATVMLGIVAIGVTSEQAADAAGLPVSGKQTTRSMADVEVIGSDDWWTVGTVSTADDERPWVRHWDGTGWDTVPTPDLGAARGGLANIAAVAADDIWAMGSMRAPDGTESVQLIEHWDGSAWSVVDAPAAGHDVTVQSVSAAAADDVWAVGSHRVDGSALSYRPLTEHWNGQVWRVVRNPALNADISFAFFRGVTAVGPGDAWAVGLQGHTDCCSYRESQLIEHWNGHRWREVQGDSLPSLSRLTAVAGTGPDDVWAAGWYVTGGDADDSVMEHWDGKRWTRVDSPNHEQKNEVVDLVATAPDDVWGVGSSYLAKHTSLRIQHWDGVSWQMVDAPAPPGGGAVRLSGVSAVTSTQAVAVGRGVRMFSELWDGTTWTLGP